MKIENYKTCNDGSESGSNGSGTCSWHGGVAHPEATIIIIIIVLIVLALILIVLILGVYNAIKNKNIERKERLKKISDEEKEGFFNNLEIPIHFNKKLKIISMTTNDFKMVRFKNIREGRKEFVVWLESKGINKKEIDNLPPIEKEKRKSHRWKYTDTYKLYADKKVTDSLRNNAKNDK